MNCIHRQNRLGSFPSFGRIVIPFGPQPNSSHCQSEYFGTETLKVGGVEKYIPACPIVVVNVVLDSDSLMVFCIPVPWLYQR